MKSNPVFYTHLITLSEGKGVIIGGRPLQSSLALPSSLRIEPLSHFFMERIAFAGPILQLATFA
ncbi:MAG: hypothetical protein A2169_15380 [Deltaproteobacteria bacterium RBG_13_47_9]|nr:MAG: hypothetical protein A2169_15380 [Deltaproteobacteria bacterium RBG_13_47_9]